MTGIRRRSLKRETLQEYLRRLALGGALLGRADWFMLSVDGQAWVNRCADIINRSSDRRLPIPPGGLESIPYRVSRKNGVWAAVKCEVLAAGDEPYHAIYKRVCDKMNEPPTVATVRAVTIEVRHTLRLFQELGIIDTQALEHWRDNNAPKDKRQADTRDVVESAGHSITGTIAPTDR